MRLLNCSLSTLSRQEEAGAIIVVSSLFLLSGILGLHICWPMPWTVIFPYILPVFLVVHGGRTISITVILCGQTEKSRVVQFCICFPEAPDSDHFYGNSWLDIVSMWCCKFAPHKHAVLVWGIHYIFCLSRTAPRQMESFSIASLCQLVIFLLFPFLFWLSHSLCISDLCRDPGTNSLPWTIQVYISHSGMGIKTPVPDLRAYI